MRTKYFVTGTNNSTRCYGITLVNYSKILHISWIEVNNFWLGDNYAIEPFASLLFVNGDPKGNSQKYIFFSAKFADISKTRQVTAGKVCFPDFLSLAYTPI